jgi:hypothetical protein
MARINQALLRKLQNELGIGQRRAYELIEQKMAETHLDRHLAAIALASEHGIGIAKYATSEDLATIRGASSRRPNSAPTPAPPPVVKRIVKPTEPISLDLSFISSNELREILQRDIAELNIARAQGLDKTSKTCMVLCGSIVEALLLDCLLQDKAAAVAIGLSLPKRLSSNPEDWDLHDMVTVATHLSPPLLPDDAITGANQLRQWRNLIHPGRELKDARNKRITPTAPRAQNAISFLQFIAEELGP